MPTAIGERAPDFELPATDGERHTLSAEGAPATVVYWTCNHCPYALAWHERLLDVARDYSDRGVRVLAISSNDPERYLADSFEAMVERVQQEGGWPHPCLHDENRGSPASGAQSGRRVFVLDSGLQLLCRGRSRCRPRRSITGRGLASRRARRGLAGQSPTRRRPRPRLPSSGSHDAMTARRTRVGTWGSPSSAAKSSDSKHFGQLPVSWSFLVHSRVLAPALRQSSYSDSPAAEGFGVIEEVLIW
jgi:hypothetical protein